MSLIIDTLEGVIDRVAVAIKRIQAFEPEAGYYVAFSGGKDSQAVLDLVERSGVKFDAHMNLTTVDPPELLRFVRENYADRVTLERPDTSMYKLIVKKRIPPTRMARYCCEALKERGGHGRIVVTGIRWAESNRRNKRRVVESCFKDGTKTFLHPIIDWSDEDVWEYLSGRGLPHCSLYDEGKKRIGCVMCPLNHRKMQAEADRWPKFAAMYERACVAAYDKAVADGLERKTWKDGHDMYRWWLTGCAADKVDPQLFPMDN
jgi:phosphoadenosine phosphosulfate reductase